MIDRRTFLSTLTLSLLAGPLTTEAQQPRRMARIGWLDPSPTPTAAAPLRTLTPFRQRLKELGWVEGRTVVIESRFADTYWNRLPELAQDLARGVDVIVTIRTPAAMVTKKATTTIPIVMAGVGEPLELGLAPSLC
jgi:putative ABC transport system substrate-binding protein